MARICCSGSFWKCQGTKERGGEGSRFEERMRPGALMAIPPQTAAPPTA